MASGSELPLDRAESEQSSPTRPALDISAVFLSVSSGLLMAFSALMLAGTLTRSAQFNTTVQFMFAILGGAGGLAYFGGMAMRNWLLGQPLGDDSLSRQVRDHEFDAAITKRFRSIRPALQSAPLPRRPGRPKGSATGLGVEGGREKRAQALLLKKQGLSFSVIAKQFGIDNRTAMRWVQAAKEDEARK